jgi:hypothetical protein
VKDIWDGNPHRLYPDKDFFSAKFAGDIEPVSEAEGDARLTVHKLDGMDLHIAQVNNGFNAYATRVKRIAEAFDLEIRLWYVVGKEQVEYKAHRLSPEKIAEYWVQCSTPVSEEIRNVLV